VKLSVAVPSPETNVTALVPSPVQVMLARQSKYPLVVTLVLVTTNGSARAVEFANEVMTNVRIAIAFELLMCDPWC
jgi:hypothetical protein